jgi:hypothetical protein
LASVESPIRRERIALVALDFDQRSLTLQVVDPLLDGLSSGSAEVRVAAAQRTASILYNLSRLAFGLYAGIDRFTVMLGTTDVPVTTLFPSGLGRFDPETRMMLSQKSFARLDWNSLREKNGQYGQAEIAATDLQWYRWTR